MVRTGRRPMHADGLTKIVNVDARTTKDAVEQKSTVIGNSATAVSAVGHSTIRSVAAWNETGSTTV
jgi:hypothetical protein